MKNIFQHDFLPVCLDSDIHDNVEKEKSQKVSSYAKMFIFLMRRID